LPEKQFDPWETSSGLPDDFDFYITRAEFGYIPEYTDNAGEPQLLLLLYGESPDVELDRPIPYSVGKGWQPVKGGKEVVHEDGKKLFVSTSMYGRFIERVVKELGVDMRSRGLPQDATVWEGLGFHMKREKIEYPGLMSDRGGATERLMPTKFLGEKGKKTKGKSRAETKEPASKEAKEAASEPEEKKEAAAGESGGPPKKLIKKLEILARKTDDYNEFTDKAMDDEEVMQYDNLVDDIIDDSEDGFWARARAKK